LTCREFAARAVVVLNVWAKSVPSRRESDDVAR
jgi:hypothetical protein